LSSLCSSSSSSSSFTSSRTESYASPNRSFSKMANRLQVNGRNLNGGDEISPNNKLMHLNILSERRITHFRLSPHNSQHQDQQHQQEQRHQAPRRSSPYHNLRKHHSSTTHNLPQGGFVISPRNCNGPKMSLVQNDQG